MRYRARMQRAIAILGLLSVSCSGSSETRQPAGGEPSAPAPAPAATAPTTAWDASPATAPAAVADTGVCAADADCAFDDPCMPKRCVTATSAPAPVGCDKSYPPTGTCVCFEKRCSLRPGPTHPKVAVDTACVLETGCTLDRAAGSCAPGRDEDFRADRSTGPRCDCDRKALRCQFSWLDPVECKTVDDCWVEDEPFSHPIKRPASRKGKEFRPCKDGEVAPGCAEGRCTLRAYGC